MRSTVLFFPRILKAFAIFSTAFLSILSGVLQAQNIESSLLWSIEVEGIKPSFLYGTLHVLPQSDFNLKPRVIAALESTQVLVMELDMTQPNMQAEMMQRATMKGGTTLNEILSPGDYKKLDSLLQNSMGLALTALSHMKPFVVSTFLLSRYIEGPAASFELAFAQMAEERQMKVFGLETIAEQMNFFDEIPYASQGEELSKMLHEDGKYRLMYADMVALYRREQLQELFDMILEQITDDEERRIMLDSRNERWIPKMEALAKDSSVFFAVGAGHLPGEKGLISLLRKQGLKVNPVFAE